MSKFSKDRNEETLEANHIKNMELIYKGMREHFEETGLVTLDAAIRTLKKVYDKLIKIRVVLPKLKNGKEWRRFVNKNLDNCIKVEEKSVEESE